MNGATGAARGGRLWLEWNGAAVRRDGAALHAWDCGGMKVKCVAPRLPSGGDARVGLAFAFTCKIELLCVRGSGDIAHSRNGTRKKLRTMANTLIFQGK